MFLLDTNAISELRKPKPHGAVVAWLRERREEELFVSAFTLGELQRGVEKTRARDVEKAREIERWIDRVADSYRVLPLDAAMFREWARIMFGKPQELAEDALIAATARVRGLTVATLNVRHFEGFGVEVVNPFATESG